MYELIKKETEFAGGKLSFETGQLAPQAGGSVVVKFGDTEVLVTATSSPSREDVDFFPLRVDYEEKHYAGGVINSSRFLKREGRPSDKSILGARLIDRSIRPLFPKGYKDQVQIITTVLSYDEENGHQILSLLGTAASLAISDIPFENNFAAVIVGVINDQLVVNPTNSQLLDSSAEILVSGDGEKVIMIETAAKEISDEVFMKAIELANKEITKLVKFISEFKKEVGKEKKQFVNMTVSDEIRAMVEDVAKKDLLALMSNWKDKMVFEASVKELTTKITPEIMAQDNKITQGQIGEAMFLLQKHLLRDALVKDKKRIDGREYDQIREITIQTDLLSRTHGSAMFARGLTQVLSVTTLASPSFELLIHGMEGEHSKRYMHHYSSAPFSIGEVFPLRGPGRRDIGHGELAEKALQPVLPNKTEFPYTVRVVSEVLSQNGSSSMAATCGSSLSLMVAGVPIKKHVAGMSVGLIEHDKGYVLITDIMGIEDFIGDMDFKVTGTRDGITAVQLDVKNSGLTVEMIKEVMVKQTRARNMVLDTMEKVIDKPRAELSQYAPMLDSVTIDPEKIGLLIGPSGKTIKALMKDTNTTVDVEDDGTVSITAQSKEDLERAIKEVKAITGDIKVGEMFDGEVVSIKNYGAFVNLIGQKDGLLHISEVSDDRVEDIESLLSVGDKLKVKVIGVDKEGKINLTIKGISQDK